MERNEINTNNKYKSSKERIRPEDNEARDTGIVAGRNAVRELLKSGREIDKIVVSGREGSIVALVAEARERGIPVTNADSSKLDYLAKGANHQGIVAFAAQKEYSTVE